MCSALVWVSCGRWCGGPANIPLTLCRAPCVGGQFSARDLAKGSRADRFFFDDTHVRAHQHRRDYCSTSGPLSVSAPAGGRTELPHGGLCHERDTCTEI